ncbi:uncharacterized protein LOC6616615 [Drosophila sechellia]|uniref:uncharacterized protein LOC6616615 n=1 Tax=Drosophila sechellia TaxID=7238 RepID=UPI0013DE0B14|nr:uncharacterized protein LOC6616615 [Drosophila sechellia]
MGSNNNEDQNVAVSGWTQPSSPEFIKEERLYTELDSQGRMISRTMTPYECQLEGEVEQLQEALFKISSHYAKVQFGLRQISLASGSERDNLLKDLERLTAKGLDATGAMRDGKFSMPAKLRVKQDKILCQLRGSLGDLVGATGVSCHANHSHATNRSLKISTDSSNRTPTSKDVGQGCGISRRCIGHATEDSKPATGHMKRPCGDLSTESKIHRYHTKSVTYSKICGNSKRMEDGKTRTNNNYLELL